MIPISLFVFVVVVFLAGYGCGRLA